MGIERADILYPRNGTVVDSGTGIDVRLLDDTQGATLETQTVTALHTDDADQRVFDPASANNVDRAILTLAKLGWALRLTEDMTPTDDANCNAVLKAGTLVFSMDVTINQAGGTYGAGTYAPTWACALFRYNPSTDTGTGIAFGTTNATAWTYTAVGSDLGVFKTVAGTVVIPADVEFSPGEIFYVQYGVNVGTIPNPLAGTATWTFTLRTDSPNSKTDFAADQGIRARCALTESLTGKGTAAESAKDIGLPRSLAGKGESAGAKAAVAAKSFDLLGKGTAFEAGKDITQPRSLTGKGTAAGAKAVVASKSFDLVGEGFASESPKSLALPRALEGKGTAAGEKTVVAAKSFDLTGKGEITEVHPVQAYRTFVLTGKGTVDGRIEIPIDEVPTGDAVAARKTLYIFDD